MEEITLKQYFELKGYGKGMKAKGMNISDFAVACGVSVSLISKIYNGNYRESGRSVAVAKIKEFLNKENFTLKLVNNEANINLIKENEKLKKQNRVLSDKLLEFENELANYKGLVAFCDKVSIKYGKGNKNSIKRDTEPLKLMLEE